MARPRLLDELAERLDAVPLILDLDGDVLEAGYANLFIVEGTHLVTPPLDGRPLPARSARECSHSIPRARSA